MSNHLIIKISFNRKLQNVTINDFVIFVVKSRQEAIDMLFSLVSNVQLNSLIIEEKSVDKLDVITHDYGDINFNRYEHNSNKIVYT